MNTHKKKTSTPTSINIHPHEHTQKKKTPTSTSEAMLNQENPAFSGGALKKSGGFP